MNKTIKSIISNLSKIFQHDCENNLKCVSKNYFRCGVSGVVFKLSSEYVCTKCGKLFNR